jgi:hypothetical protein
MRHALGPIALAIVLASTACATAPIPHNDTPSLAVETAPAVETAVADCTNVESQLQGLLEAADRPAFAGRQGLDLEGAAVRVIIELDSAQPGLTLPAVIERTDGPLVQALVSPDRLCEIGARPSVRLVRAAHRAEPLSGAARSERR